MAAVKGISKLSGQAKASTYPQPEGVLGECMTSYGRKLGEDSIFGKTEIIASLIFQNGMGVVVLLSPNRFLLRKNFIQLKH